MLNKSVKKYFFLFTLLVAFLSACDTNPSNVQVAMRDTKLNIIPITQVSGSAQTLTQVGLPFQFIAVEEVAGEYKDVTQKVTWHSSNPEVASVGQGQVRGMKKGETLIYALLPITSASGLNADSFSDPSSGSFTHRRSNKISLLIKDEPLLVLQISPNEMDHPTGTLAHKLPVGAKQSLNAVATFADNTSFDVTSFVDWQSQNNGIVDLNQGETQAFAERNFSTHNAFSGMATAEMRAVGDSDIYATLFNKTSNTLGLAVSDASLDALLISPENASIAVDSHQEFTATAIYSDGTQQNVTQHVTWHSAKPRVALMSGEEAHALSPGSTKISASLNQRISDPVSLTVTDAKLAELQITPSEPMLNVGEDLFYKVKAIFDDGSTDDISEHVLWQSSEPDVAQVIGSYTKAASVGQAQIQAVYQGITSNTSTLTVSDHQLIGLQLTPTVSELAKSTQTELTVMGEYDDGESIDITNKVTWQSEDPNIAFISHGHVYGTAVGNTRIYTVFDGVKSNEALIRVINPTISALHITPVQKTIPIQGSVDYQAQATFVDGDITTRQDVSHLVAWKNENKTIANLAQYHAIGLQKGDTTITANLDLSPTQASLTVTDMDIKKLQLTPSTITLAKGTSQSLQVMATYKDDSTGDVTDNVSWHLSDNTLASIDSETNEITAIKEGSAILTAHWKNDAVISNEVSIRVPEAQLLALYVTPESHEIINHNSANFKAYGAYSDGSYQDITALVSWSSSDTTKATVLKGNVLSLEAGTTRISANFNGVYGNVAPVSIIADTLESISITTANGSDIEIPIGITERFIATGTYKSGRQIDITKNNGVIWSTSNPAILIDNEGVATGIAEQEGVSIFANKEGKKGNVTVNAISAEVKSLRIEKHDSRHRGELTQGSRIELKAIAVFSDGKEKEVTTLVSWSEDSNSILATVLNGVVLSGKKNGEVLIKAHYKGFSAEEIKIFVIPKDNLHCSIGEISLPYEGKTLKFYCPVRTDVYPGAQYREGTGWGVPNGMQVVNTNWDTANEHCLKLNRRLPSIKELVALLKFGNSSQAYGFGLYYRYGWPISGNYWSGTEAGVNRHWTLDMYSQYNWSGLDEGADYFSISCVEEVKSEP